MSNTKNRWEVHYGTRRHGSTIVDSWEPKQFVSDHPTREQAREAAKAHAPVQNVGAWRDGIYRVYDSAKGQYLGSQIAEATPAAKPTPKPRKKAAAKKGAAPKTKKLVNHVALVLDASPSMYYHVQNVRKVVTSLLGSMAASGIDTRVSIYTFSGPDQIRRECFDTTPALAQFEYTVKGNSTALIDASLTCIRDLATIERSVATLGDEDHTFLVYVITDGEDNTSRNPVSTLRTSIDALSDSWTIATMVPNATGVHRAKMCGFPAGNIEVWKAHDAKGFEEVGNALNATYSDYSTARSMGVRSSSTLFVDASNINTNIVQSLLTETTGGIYTSHGTYQIRDYVEQVTGKPYMTGSAFYELTKRETIQPQKQIVIVEKNGGRKYAGADARRLLGLPDYKVDVAPGDFGAWQIFVQSTSVNRKIVAGTRVYIK